MAGLTQLELDLIGPSAARLYEHAVRSDLPVFLAWTLVYQAESGEPRQGPADARRS